MEIIIFLLVGVIVILILFILLMFTLVKEYSAVRFDETHETL
jgi:hypothetical protein